MDIKAIHGVKRKGWIAENKDGRVFIHYNEKPVIFSGFWDSSAMELVCSNKPSDQWKESCTYFDPCA